MRIAELEAEAAKVQQVKQAEGEAQVHVLQAKGEADAMQYTLPLKEKQIQQSRLEAQARKEATIQNAEAEAQAKEIDGKAEGERRKLLADAEAQAKVMDSKAEGERRRLLAEAEADRIRVTAVADAERLHSEAAILKDNPLLINKIVAERLSDKLQIMMVPADGKFFFANDVLRGMDVASQGKRAERQTIVSTPVAGTVAVACLGNSRRRSGGVGNQTGSFTAPSLALPAHGRHDAQMMETLSLRVSGRNDKRMHGVAETGSRLANGFHAGETDV